MKKMLLTWYTIPRKVISCRAFRGECLYTVNMTIAAPFESRVGCINGKSETTRRRESDRCTDQYCEFCSLQLSTQLITFGVDADQVLPESCNFVSLVQDQCPLDIEFSGLSIIRRGQRTSKSGGY
jgi:hypothetical protein